MFLLFENVQTEDGKRRTNEHQCAWRAPGRLSAALWASSVLALHALQLSSLLVPAGPLIPQFCVNMFLGAKIQMVSRMHEQASRTQLQLRREESGSQQAWCSWTCGENISVLCSTFPDRNPPHLPLSVVLFLHSLIHSTLTITSWQSASFSAFFFFFFFFFVPQRKDKCVWGKIKLWRLKRGCFSASTGCHRERWGSPTTSPLFRPVTQINNLYKAPLRLFQSVYQKSHVRTQTWWLLEVCGQTICSCM